jgi:hypothetical protein
MHSVVAAGALVRPVAGGWPGPALLSSSVVSGPFVHKDGDGPCMASLPPRRLSTDRSNQTCIPGTCFRGTGGHRASGENAKKLDGYVCGAAHLIYVPALFFHRSRGSAGELRVGAFLAALLSS